MNSPIDLAIASGFPAQHRGSTAVRPQRPTPPTLGAAHNRSSASLPHGAVRPAPGGTERGSLSEDSLSSDGSALSGAPQHQQQQHQRLTPPGAPHLRGAAPATPLGTSSPASVVSTTSSSLIHPASQKNGGGSASGSLGGGGPATATSSISPESGIGADATNGSSSFGGGANIAEQEIYNDVDPLPVLGTALAVYTFDGGSDGTVRIADGEELLLIERDEGDGWTRVRRQPPSARAPHPAGGLGEPDEGFVPTSYLECKWYPKE